MFTESLIQVYVDGALEIDYAGTFSDGSFGFYNYSQEQVTYAGITTALVPVDPDPMAPVPLPTSLPLMLAGLGAFGIARRRKA